MDTTQESCMLFWTIPGSSSLQNSNCTPTYLPSHKPSKIRCVGHCWKSKVKLINDVLLWIPTHGHTSVGWLARIYIHDLCVNTGCCLEDLTWVIFAIFLLTEFKRLQFSVRNLPCPSTKHSKNLSREQALSWLIPVLTRPTLCWLF